MVIETKLLKLVFNVYFQTLSAAKKSLTIQIEDFQRENKELSGEVRALQKAQRYKLIIFTFPLFNLSQFYAKSNNKTLKRS